MLALALLCAPGAQAAGGTQVFPITLTMSDGAKLACSTTIPGDIPITPRPGVILFHGLGGKHQDMEPIAAQFFAPAGYETLECDARGHGTSEGLFGLDGLRDVQDTQELFNWLAGQLGDTNIGALGQASHVMEVCFHRKRRLESCLLVADQEDSGGEDQQRKYYE